MGRLSGQDRPGRPDNRRRSLLDPPERRLDDHFATRARFVFFQRHHRAGAQSARTAYGKLLQVRGITCSTGPEYGVNCAGGGHHFTISTDDYWMG